MPRTELIGYLDKPNQRLLTGQDSWPVNGRAYRTAETRRGSVSAASRGRPEGIAQSSLFTVRPLTSCR